MRSNKRRFTGIGPPPSTCVVNLEDVEGSPERFLVGLLPPAVRREDVPGVTGLVDELLKAADGDS